ncbi:MAG: GNAT family N-acetyltransferase [Rhodobacteraceae bacterium]|nr:GNAT family N-acetyltransferase [Paracoccaceae bacterium]
MSRVIPTINTARLTLRAFRAEDFDRFAEIWASPEVTRYIGAEPRARNTSWDMFLRNAGHWQMTGFGQWAIEDHATKALIGQAGFFHGMRGLGEDFDAHPEAGWVLAPEAQNQGYGWEAVSAAHDWFDRVITGPLVAQIVPKNVASVRVASRLGYAEMRAAGDVMLMLRRTPIN